MSISVPERFERAKSLYAIAQSRQPIARSLTDIPVSYELISDEWLTLALCARVPDAKVIGHTLDEPDEGTTNRRRIFLNYNHAGQQAGLPKSVFCKATQSLGSRMVLGLNRSIECESIFFNLIRPLLDIEAPVGLHSRMDADSLNSILIMEDLTGLVDFCESSTKITLDYALDQIMVLARLHGTFYSDPAKRALIGGFPALREWCDLTEQALDWSTARARGFEIAEHVVPAGLYRRRAEIGPATKVAFAYNDMQPQTLIHNDVHVRNWYVTAKGQMGLGDWQICSRGTGIRDVAYAISSSLDTEDRRKWELDLIEHYIDQLAAMGVTLFTREQALLSYRQQLPSALAMWTATLCPTPGMPDDMQPEEASLTIVKRICHAMDDWDSLDCL